MEVADEASATLVGASAQVSPGWKRAARVTVPVKPWRLTRVIGRLPVEPPVVVRDEGLAKSEKSWNAKFTVTMWLRLPLVAVTVTA